jgi:cellulose biosynthesis protein BcsQ/type II secretory pathway pseudopilin PulG
MTESTTNQSGQIITFYSYKGGTGRTMALANIGCLLASQLSNQDKILMIDWDLEAPGLHQYFKDRIFHSAYSSSGETERKAPGLIELLLQLNELTPDTPPQSGLDEERYAEKALSKISIDDYVLQTHEPNLFLMKAGSFEEGYADRTSTFDWEGLYLRSPMLFFSLAHKLTERYKFVLIDSRTGLTDTSGICTMLMPEKLVLVFTPNRQSLTGVLDLVSSATEYRRQSEDLRPLMIFPLPSRIEASEPKRKEIWRFGDDRINGYEPLFENAFKQVYGLKECSLGSYFDDVQVQHVPQYSYGEEIAVLIEKRGDKLSLTRTYQTLLEKMIFAESPWDEAADTTLADYASVITETKVQLQNTETAHQKSESKLRIVSVVSIILISVFIALGVIGYQDYTKQAAELDAKLNRVETAQSKLKIIQTEVNKLLSNSRTGAYPSTKQTAPLVSQLESLRYEVDQLTKKSSSAYIDKESKMLQQQIEKSLYNLKQASSQTKKAVELKKQIDQ